MRIDNRSLSKQVKQTDDEKERKQLKVPDNEQEALAKSVKGSTYALGKAPENLTTLQTQLLALIAESHPKLYKALIEWRNQEAARIKLPVYTVLQQKAILGLTNLMPRNKKELMRTPCIGKKTIDKYGETLISIIEKHAEDGARGLFSGG